MNKERFLELCKSYTAVPVYKRLLADVLTPVSLFMNVRQDAINPFLLESVEGGEKLARYSFIGRNPYQTLSFDGAVTILSSENGSEVIEKPYFEELRSQTTKYTEPSIPELPRLTGGAVGFSAYDTFRLVEDLPNVPEDDLNLPEAVWCFYDEIYAFDHVKHQVILIKTVFVDEDADHEELYDSAHQDLERMEASAMSGNYNRRAFDIDPKSLKSNVEESRFKNTTRTVKKGTSQ